MTSPTVQFWFTATGLRTRLRLLTQAGRKSPTGALGLMLVSVLIGAALLAPVLAPFPGGGFVGYPNEGPTREFLLGTDHFGRDILSRVLLGARVSLPISLVAVGIGTGLGALAGAVSGYRGGWLDLLLLRCVDAITAVPTPILLLVIVRLLEPSTRSVVIAVGVGVTPIAIRLARALALSESRQEYVEAARALGARDTHVVLRHVLLGITPTLGVFATGLVGSAIIAEATLTFLGLGLPPTEPSWGTDIAVARAHTPIGLPTVLAPGAAIALTVLGFTLLGDGLRDLLDPHGRRSGRRVLLSR